MFLLLVLFFNVLLHYGVPGDMLMSWMLFFCLMSVMLAANPISLGI